MLLSRSITQFIDDLGSTFTSHATHGDLRVRKMCTKFAILHSLSLVNAHGTSFQQTFDLVAPSNLLNVNLTDIQFVSPMVFNQLLSTQRVADIGALVMAFRQSSCYSAIEIFVIIINIIILTRYSIEPAQP